MLTKRLEMIFRNAGGGRTTISVLDPKDTLTEAEVQAAMQTIITKNIFETSGGDLVGIIGARVVTTDVTDLIAG
ncbi:DUF2922 domain-containing protein [Zhaonella formicivorans]|jgi:hypothetical protein|uniref:DUF2922 domain-containing protein n=1 Tax=Zhaonella formicivorans TaxID=2528593 RepID=UPI0010D4136C|nr:DUF2922 domain-containing protein [Zhaonella formicivorans]